MGWAAYQDHVWAQESAEKLKRRIGELEAELSAAQAALEQAEQRTQEAWQMIGAMLIENGDPFRVSSRSLHLAPTAPIFTGSEDLDGSVLLALTTPEGADPRVR